MLSKEQSWASDALSGEHKRRIETRIYERQQIVDDLKALIKIVQ